MAPRRCILVTGAGGCVGRALRARAAGRGEVDLVALDHAALDVRDPDASAAALATWRPDAVIFAAAITDVDRCAVDPHAHAVNVEAPAWWARRCPTWLLSTNYVFDGPGPHVPDNPRRPAGAYARQKAEAEDRVRDAGGHVVRVGWVVGPGGRTFASRLAGRLRAGETVAAIADRVVQPTWSEDLAEALLALPPGVTHLVGREETSWYTLARAVAARVGAGRVDPVQADALALAEPRPVDARLAPATLPGWTERLDRICELG